MYESEEYCTLMIILASVDESRQIPMDRGKRVFDKHHRLALELYSFIEIMQNV